MKLLKLQSQSLYAVQILGQAQNPAVIQAHLKKLFAGIHQVVLTDSKDAITAAMSIESEQVHLASAVLVNDQVDSWLHSLMFGMQSTLQVSGTLPLSSLLQCLAVTVCLDHVNTEPSQASAFDNAQCFSSFSPRTQPYRSAAKQLLQHIAGYALPFTVHVASMLFVHACFSPEAQQQQHKNCRSSSRLRHLACNSSHLPLLLMQGLLADCMQRMEFKTMPSQILCLAAAIKFTQQAENAIETKQLTNLQASFPCSAILSLCQAMMLLQTDTTQNLSASFALHFILCHWKEVYRECLLVVAQAAAKNLRWSSPFIHSFIH